MRGFNAANEGGAVGMVLKIAPIVCSFFAFVFLAVALSAGQSSNYLEGLSVVNFNMSTFGQNMIGKVPKFAEEAKKACEKANGAIDDAAKKAGDAVGQAVDGAEDAIDKAGDVIQNIPKPPKLPFARRQGAGDKVGGAIGKAGDVLGDGVSAACKEGADAAQKVAEFGQDAVNKALGSVAKAIGVKEYYSIHIGNLCEGEYKPRFNDKDAKVNVQSCTEKFKVAKTDLSKKLDQELSVGPFKFKYSEIGIVDVIQDVLDLIPRILAAMGFFFLFSTILLALGFAGTVAIAVADYKFQSAQPLILTSTLVLLGLGGTMAGIGTLGLTAVANKIKNTVNEHGAKFGMSANTSTGLYFLIWTASVLTTIAFCLVAYMWWGTRHPSGARSKIDESLDSQKNIARGQYQEEEEPYQVMQGAYPPPSNIAPNRESYYPDEEYKAGQGQPQGQPQY